MHKCTLGDRSEELLILFFQGYTRPFGCKLLPIRVLQPKPVEGRNLSLRCGAKLEIQRWGVLPWLDSRTLDSLPTGDGRSSSVSPFWHSCSLGCRPARTPTPSKRSGRKASECIGRFRR